MTPALLATDKLDLSREERELLREALKATVARSERYADHCATIGKRNVAREFTDRAADARRVATKLGLGWL